MRVAIYARYSSENQRDASIADQLRLCRLFADKEGWQVHEESTDHAISGATLLRAGFQAMMRTHLHVGLKGTMNALVLKDLADKTRRGLRGRIELGKSGGGVCYGYNVVRSPQNGVLASGEREIVPAEASVVLRIFRDYGLSPKAIAKQLNSERVSGPDGGAWNPSTIHGNPARGTGVLNTSCMSDALYGTVCVT